ncbi:hypothetical protein DSUL_30088 [Desulfovibrionales bacterium]
MSAVQKNLSRLLIILLTLTNITSLVTMLPDIKLAETILSLVHSPSILVVPNGK